MRKYENNIKIYFREISNWVNILSTIFIVNLPLIINTHLYTKNRHFERCVLNFKHPTSANTEIETLIKLDARSDGWILQAASVLSELDNYLLNMYAFDSSDYTELNYRMIN